MFTGSDRIHTDLVMDMVPAGCILFILCFTVPDKWIRAYLSHTLRSPILMTASDLIRVGRHPDLSCLTIDLNCDWPKLCKTINIWFRYSKNEVTPC